MHEIIFTPIGVIHTPFKQRKGTPIQPSKSSHAKGRIELDPELVPGLKDLDGFSHITLVYHLHLSQGFDMEVVPYLDDQLRGLFATRAPRRPNPIGISVVRLLGIEGNVLHVENVDMVDGTPLLDIKPYVSTFEDSGDFKLGWLEGKADGGAEVRDDGRFEESSDSAPSRTDKKRR